MQTNHKYDFKLQVREKSDDIDTSTKLEMKLLQ